MAKGAPAAICVLARRDWRGRSQSTLRVSSLISRLRAGLPSRALRRSACQRRRPVSQISTLCCLELPALFRIEQLMAQFNALDDEYYEGAEEPLAVKLFEYIRTNRDNISLEHAMVGGRRRLI